MLAFQNVLIFDIFRSHQDTRVSAFRLMMEVSRDDGSSHLEWVEKCGGEAHNALLAIQKLLVIGP